jgi:two-component system, response regulator YesN
MDEIVAAARANRAVTHAPRPADAARLVVADRMRDGLSLSVQQMLREIDQRYFDPLTLDVLAARLKQDPRYLGRRFRIELGISVHEYLVQVRLDHAAAAIRRGVKIDAVSLLVGYRSKKNFFSAFKRRFGTTPGAYATPARTGLRKKRPRLLDDA